MKLQPLELGAIFQRAMALYTRNFIPFAAAVVATIIPVAMLQYVVGVREQPQVDATIDLLQHPDRLRTEHIPLLSPETLALATASALFGYLMLAFAFGAVASGVAAYYRGEVVSLAACYRTVLVRWLSVVAVVATAVLVLASAYFASIAVIALPVFAIAAVASSLLPVLAPFAITGMLCAMAFVVLILIVTSSGTVCAVVVEGCSASSAVPLTVARTLNRREFGAHAALRDRRRRDLVGRVNPRRPGGVGVSLALAGRVRCSRRAGADARRAVSLHRPRALLL